LSQATQDLFDFQAVVQKFFQGSASLPTRGLPGLQAVCQTGEDFLGFLFLLAAAE
jgi:hypothetical protein